MPTKSSKQRVVKQRVSKAAQPQATTYRVVPLPPSVRDTLKSARAEHGTNQAALSAAVANLPALLRELAKLGIGKKVTAAKCQKYRLPFTPQAIDELREAAQETGLDATLLLKILVAGL
jgi:hypothetical protein